MWVGTIFKDILSFPHTTRADVAEAQKEACPPEVAHAESEKAQVRFQALRVRCFRHPAPGLPQTRETQPCPYVSFADNLLCLQDFLHFLSLPFVLILCLGHRGFHFY